MLFWVIWSTVQILILICKLTYPCYDVMIYFSVICKKSSEDGGENHWKYLGVKINVFWTLFCCGCGVLLNQILRKKISVQYFYQDSARVH